MFIKNVASSFVDRFFRSSCCVDSLTSFIDLEVRHCERSINHTSKGLSDVSQLIRNILEKLLAHSLSVVGDEKPFLAGDVNMNS